MGVAITNEADGSRLIRVSYPGCELTLNFARPHTGPLYDAEGNEIGSATVALNRADDLLDADARAKLAHRRPICEACPENGGLTQLTVKCKGCGCSGLSLLNGRCKLGRW